MHFCTNLVGTLRRRKKSRPEAAGGVFRSRKDPQHPYGVYLYYHSTFLTILHELGHAVGLGHIPVDGNIMSYSRWEGFSEQWADPMALYMNMLQARFGAEAVANDFFFDHHDHNRIRFLVWMPITDDRTRILTNFYTSKLRLGAQEKMLLACIYEF